MGSARCLFEMHNEHWLVYSNRALRLAGDGYDESQGIVDKQEQFQYENSLFKVASFAHVLG
jgi:hypothetical protein